MFDKDSNSISRLISEAPKTTAKIALRLSTAKNGSNWRTIGSWEFKLPASLPDIIMQTIAEETATLNSKSAFSVVLIGKDGSEGRRVSDVFEPEESGDKALLVSTLNVLKSRDAALTAYMEQQNQALNLMMMHNNNLAAKVVDMADTFMVMVKNANLQPPNPPKEENDMSELATGIIGAVMSIVSDWKAIEESKQKQLEDKKQLLLASSSKNDA